MIYVHSKDVHGSGSLFFIAVAARHRQFIFHYRRGAVVYFSLPSRRSAASAAYKTNSKIREFTQNFHFKERYTVKLDEFHRLEAIALV
jgi:hypothetical protein